METNITSQEAWRILDAIVSYKNDYELSVTVIKTLSSAEKKMKKIVDEE
jgi:exonuclease VII small subunit